MTENNKKGVQKSLGFVVDDFFHGYAAIINLVIGYRNN